MKTFLRKGLAVLTMLSLTSLANSQDGAALFSSKCNTCHLVDKNSTGPLLKGAKQKWADAGEGELIYEWVKNPQNLIASGKSKMATAIKTYSPTEMPPQAVSKEEVDAILDYVDNYTAAAPTDQSATGTADATASASTPVEVVTDYNENLNLFYWLCASILVLLIAIIIVSSSITTLVKSDYFKSKMSKKNTTGTVVSSVVLVVGFLGLLLNSTTANALTFVGAGEGDETTPWLKVEAMDLYFMVAINIILVMVLLYLRRMFRDFMAMVHTPKAEEAAVPSAIKKINVILTDAVAIEEEHTILMQHEYDGIRELDNNLPPWWVWGFYITIIFAVIYVFNYHIFRTSDLQIEAYNKEVAQAKKDIDAYLAKMAMNVDETNVTLLTDATALSAGSALFQANCVVCHNPKGEGNIGPNLTDNHWIYGPDIKDVFKTIKNGAPNGMPEHASKMNPVQLQQISSYVLSLPDAKGKEPQGTVYKDGKAVK